MTAWPRIFPVRQEFDTEHCTDIAAAVRGQFESIGLPEQLRPGASVAITVGSRGITDIAQIIRAIATSLRELGGEPFIVPAMGSHGGGTAAGQRAVIESYGVTEEFCGCPIRSSMETVIIGQAEEGFPIYFDREAFAADHVLVCGRVKSHTGFSGDIQSGLMKMMMIGLGKKDGATLYHRVIHEHGFPQIIRSVAPKVLEHANILAGVAIIENAYDNTARIEAVLPENIQAREPALLASAKQLMPSLPFRELDVLVVNEIGKNISGTGMDTNVIGRKPSEKLPDHPTISQIVVRDLTAETHGNASGIGFAEFCLTQVVNKMDRDATVLNCLTALDVAAARVPVDFPTDREVLAAALDMLGTKPATAARLAWIRNTGQLSEFFASEALLPEVEAHPRLKPAGKLQDLPLDERGMLIDGPFRAA